MALNTKQQKLVDWALSKVGCGYIWGATGYTLTQTKLDQVIAKQGENSAAAKYGKKWLGKQCYDCAQLVRWGLKAAGVEGVDISGASSQWKKGKWLAKGELDTLPSDPCIIFREDSNSSPMGHVGIYMGDGTVVHAQQTKTGVVHTKLTDGRWTHWATPYIYDEGETLPEIPSTPVRTTLRSGSNGEAVKEAQTLLNKHGAALAVDGAFGKNTEATVRAFQQANGLTADGVIGAKTWAALDEEPDVDPIPDWEGMTVEEKLDNLNERLLRLEGGDL